ncbi:MAG: energy transducer TonB [Cyclobacteriaceae bacterium]|jgi:TonB family protein|nr:energy transducer TonB [Flammeovirgaceae bacterium]MCZ8020119.1 energy transducer TonB [Cytophagales bacterium]MCZ8326967.1 energy transducer TonB [Cyclobacteriaceae bacterium]
MKIKFKISKEKPTITDEEIDRYINFDEVIKQYKFNRKAKLIKGALFSIGLTILIGLFVSWLHNKPTTASFETEELLPPGEEKQAVILDSDSAKKLGVNKDNFVLPNTKDNSFKKETRLGKDRDSIVKRDSASQSVSVEVIYKNAEPVSGYAHLYSYFATELRYPKESIKDSIQGIVTVSFTIDKKGKPISIKIENSLGTSFDKEVIRLIENMPPWHPATINDKPVFAKISLPVTFQIIKSNSEEK